MSCPKCNKVSACSCKNCRESRARNGEVAVEEVVLLDTLTDSLVACGHCGFTMSFYAWDDLDNSLNMPPRLRGLRRWFKRKSYAKYGLSKAQVQQAIDEAAKMPQHAPECPAARDDDAPEHELSCTCGGRDE